MTNLPARAHFNNYDPASFGWGERDPMHDSSLLREFVFDGVTFGSMHVDVHDLFTALLTELVPHIPGGLVKHQCGCYNPGSVTVGGDRSFHTYAIAIDVNWGSNPMYAKARPSGQFALPPVTSHIARSYGCEWGGDWTYPQDWMHLEVHLSPADARHAVSKPKPPPNLLEEIMALDPNSPEYQRLVKDIAHAVWNADDVPALLDPKTGKVNPANPTWYPASYLRDLDNKLNAILGKVGS